MKKILFTLALALSCAVCLSQDIISKRSGEEIEARILKVGLTEIEYRRFDNPDGPIYSILKSDLLYIEYENGSHDVFEETPQPVATRPENLFVKGQGDAMAFYDRYKPAGTGTLVVSLVSPLVGLIPAIACASTPPKDINLNFPNAELMKQDEYNFAYREKARKIKSKKVWTNWGIAFGINFVAVLFITTSGQ